MYPVVPFARALDAQSISFIDNIRADICARLSLLGRSIRFDRASVSCYSILCNLQHQVVAPLQLASFELLWSLPMAARLDEAFLLSSYSLEHAQQQRRTKGSSSTSPAAITSVVHSEEGSPAAGHPGIAVCTVDGNGIHLVDVRYPRKNAGH